MRGADPSHQNALGGKAIGQRRIAVLRPRDHATARIVDGGEVDGPSEIPDVGGDVFGGRGHGNHRTAGDGVHQPGAQRHHLQRGGQVENACDGGGHQLTDAVSGQRRGLHAVRHRPAARARTPP